MPRSINGPTAPGVRGTCARAACALGLLLGMMTHAAAAGSCAGTIQTSSLHPLPKPMVVSGATSIANSPNPELTRRFVEGLQRAGVTVAEEGGNVTLNIAVSVTGPPGSSVKSGQYEGFGWVSGEPIAAGQTVPAIRSTILALSAVLSDDVAITQSWLATIDCKVQTDDPGELAEDLGYSIGRAFGSDMERKRL
jgi:hypothetical protein